MAENNTPMERPISTIGWIIFLIILAIPGLNLILLILFSLAPLNLNLKYFCRGVLILSLVSLIVFGTSGFIFYQGIKSNAENTTISQEGKTQILDVIDKGHQLLDSLKTELQNNWAGK